MNYEITRPDQPPMPGRPYLLEIQIGQDVRKSYHTSYREARVEVSNLQHKAAAPPQLCKAVRKSDGITLVFYWLDRKPTGVEVRGLADMAEAMEWAAANNAKMIGRL